MKARRKRGKPLGKSGPVRIVFKAKAEKAGPVRVLPSWIEREEEKARRHLRSILAGG